MSEVLFLSRENQEGLAEPGEYVKAVREAYRQRGNGAAAEPRTKLTNESPPGIFTGYMAILPETGVMGGYLYSGGFEERDAWFVTPLYDAKTGEPLALLDGAKMNPFKTGAAGAVAVDELSREDSGIMGLLGSGPQAAGQLQATVTVRDFQRVKVYSPTTSHREAFAEEFDEKLKPSVVPVDSSADAVSGSDVVITATSSTEPVFDGDNLAPGTHVTAMGQYDRGNRELDTRTVQRSKYVLDLEARADRDAGAYIRALDEGIIDRDHLYGELGEIVAGKKAGRESADEITVFDSGGTGIETVAGAHLLYEKAKDRDRGRFLDFAPASQALTGRYSPDE